MMIASAAVLAQENALPAQSLKAQIIMKLILILASIAGLVQMFALQAQFQHN